jgi:hypothetical protein
VITPSKTRKTWNQHAVKQYILMMWKISFWYEAVNWEPALHKALVQVFDVKFVELFPWKIPMTGPDGLQINFSARADSQSIRPCLAH